MDGCDVLKVAHHGSAGSSCYAFLRSALPRNAVISCSADNSYGHPTDAALSRLRDCGAKVFRTDMQGDIVVESDGETVTMTPARNADADTLAAGPGGGSGVSGASQVPNPPLRIPRLPPTRAAISATPIPRSSIVPAASPCPPSTTASTSARATRRSPPAWPPASAATPRERCRLWGQMGSNAVEHG